jgi:hypothetical protein
MSISCEEGQVDVRFMTLKSKLILEAEEEEEEEEEEASVLQLLLFLRQAVLHASDTPCL